MKSLKLIGLFLLLGFFSCSNNDEPTQEKEAQYLKNLLSEIKAISTSKPCVNPSEWAFTSYGSKACGGPIGFIAYSTTIDVGLFLEKIETHRTLQENFNEKWKVFSDCSVPPTPIGISCENGKAVLQF